MGLHSVPPDKTARGTDCPACGVLLEGRSAFRIRGRASALCGRCSLVDRGIVARSTRVALVVGTALVALNQGDVLLSGDFPWAQGWYKLLLTYVVPFGVSTYGALANAKTVERAA